eukprot:TRINITY_DN8085_c1_g2_i1.p1 TRINITY_DN8085_c1_g2~~TRINITY_DN8085_c1_g2_i1.p1  ORF type:complete len:1419 (+),score=540.66 TRINITY_DN8085_c1_g2_i1:66-4322(+)
MSSSAVTVAVRCRPFNQRELDQGSENVISMEGNRTVITGGQGKSHSFTFDYSFWSHSKDDPQFASQEIVFDAIGGKIMESTFEGYNSCLFAYGQTGSGKTYSMLGYGEDTGIIPRLCEALFDKSKQKVAESDDDWDYRVQVSYLEIYNEKCRCLLNPQSKEVKPREHPLTGPYVEGLTEVIVTSFEEMNQLMDEGNKTRTVASTQMNATSSRSHAIFTITFTQHTNLKAGKGSEKASKINLVDLAGSERADKTGATGATLKEGANINRSLVCLGKVIAALADAAEASGKGKKIHIPFRDSALTWLLKENLGGNSRTIMLAALSPHVSNYEESLSTLRYADRAKRIKTHAVVNEDPTSRRIRELTEEVARLKQLLESGALLTKPPAEKKDDEAEPDEEAGEASEVSSPVGEDTGNYDKLSPAEQLAMTVKALEDAGMSWEDKERKNEEIQKERKEALHKMGIGIEIDKSLPSLVNLNEDPFMSECLVYYLKDGITTIGSLSAEGEESHICLQGTEIKEDHCTIEVGEDDEGPYALLTPLDGSVVYVNGECVSEATKLNPRDRVIFGGTHFFRFTFPKLEGAQTTRGEVVDYQMALREKYAAEAETFKKQILEEVNKEEVRREEKVAETERRARASSLKRKEAEARIKELEEDLRAAPLMSNITGNVKPPPEQDKLAPSGAAAQQKSALYTSQGGRIKHVDVGLFSANRKQVARVPPQLVRRYKVILIGHEEVGKTSLKKCWQGDPRWFKKLPDVMCTTGIEVQEHRLRYEGHGAGNYSDDDLTLSVLDFAGQEVYHSHSLFLSPRTVFCFVWKMSNYQDGEMSEVEEGRMMGWLDEVYSKAPGSAAVIVGTHKDLLPNQTSAYINRVLSNVEARFKEYIKSIRISADDDKTIHIAGSFAVSCKTRQAWGTDLPDKGAKMSELLRVIGHEAFKRCLADRVFPTGAIPGRHIQFMKELERIKKERKKLLLPIQEYAQLAADFGIEDQQELCDSTNLFHCWNVLYLFTQAKRLLDNPYIFLHPLWLAHMVSALFSFAHVVYTPPEMRRYIGGLDYDPVDALRVDRGCLRQGELSFDVVRVTLLKSIKDIRNEKHDVPVDDADFEMCLQLLVSMDLVFQHVIDTEAEQKPADPAALASSAGNSKYYIPSLFPYSCPKILQETVPYLFQKGVARMYLFNIFPKEFYYRLVCRLHHLLIPIEVPVSIPPDIGPDSQYLPPDHSFDLRNHWKNGIWIGTEGIRALIFQEDTMIYAYFLPSTTHDLADNSESSVTIRDFVKYVNEVIQTLSDEYDGLSVSCCQPCMESGCENWFDVAILSEVAAKNGMIQCQGCGEGRPAKVILSGGGIDLPPGQCWAGLWPNLKATLGSDCASALLVSLGCILDESDIQDTGEAYLKENGAKCCEWLDKFIKVVMYIDYNAQESYE